MATSLLEIFDTAQVKRSLTAEKVLFSTGEPSDGKMYVLLSGQAEILVNDTMVELAQPGAILGELALIDHQARSATVRCVKDSVFAEVDEKLFLAQIQKTPAFAIEVMTIMAARLRRVNRMI